MSVNHRGVEALVPRKFQNRFDVVAVVQQVGPKRMSIVERGQERRRAARRDVYLCRS